MHCPLAEMATQPMKMKIVLIWFSVCLINVNLACSHLSLVPGPLLQKAPDPGPILAGMYTFRFYNVPFDPTGLEFCCNEVRRGLWILADLHSSY